MVKPIGGRGRKAPYETVMVRVPLPVKSRVEALIDIYRQEILTEGESKVDHKIGDGESSEFLIALKLVDRFIKEIQQTEHLYDSTRRNNRNLARLRDWLLSHISS